MRIKLSNSLKHSVRESGMLLIQSDFCNHVRKSDSLVLHIPSLRSSTYEMQRKEKKKIPRIQMRKLEASVSVPLCSSQQVFD